MSSEKFTKFSFIAGIATVVLTVVMFIMYFIPFWTFPILKTEGEYDDVNKTVKVTTRVEDAQLSLANFIWFPTSSEDSDDLTRGGLEVVYCIGEHDGYTISSIENHLVKNVDYYEDLEEYVDFKCGTGIGKEELKLNIIVLMPVVHMVLLIACGFICGFTVKKCHNAYLPAVVSIWGIITYLTQSATLLGNFNIVFVIISAVVLLLSAFNIFVSITRFREYLARRYEILVKMGLKEPKKTKAQ